MGKSSAIVRVGFCKYEENLKLERLITIDQNTMIGLFNCTSIESEKSQNKIVKLELRNE